MIIKKEALFASAIHSKYKNYLCMNYFILQFPMLSIYNLIDTTPILPRFSLYTNILLAQLPTLIRNIYDTEN